MEIKALTVVGSVSFQHPQITKKDHTLENIISNSWGRNFFCPPYIN